MSGGSSAPSSTSNVTTRELPAWAQFPAQSLLTRGEALSNQPYQSYGGDRIAGMSQEQLTGLNKVTNRSIYGSPEENAARQNFTDTMSGKYLDQGYSHNQYADQGNPYLKGMVDQSLNDVQGRVNSQFNGNNYGTTAHQETLTRGLGEAANNAYGQAYNTQAQLADANANRQQSAYTNERNNQIKSSVLLPQYGNIDYQNAQQLIGVGDIYRQETQDALNNQYADWAAAQNQPYRQLDVLGNALGMATNGQGSAQSAGYSTTPYTANRYANAIGGGLAGYGLGDSLSGGDSTYSALGGAAGGLLGYFGG
jgi:hypothetical protein